MRHKLLDVSAFLEWILFTNKLFKIVAITAGDCVLIFMIGLRCVTDKAKAARQAVNAPLYIRDL